MKMLGRLGWRGQCSCCNGPKHPKAIRAEEKREWEREAMREMRETQMCVPPGHCWPSGHVHPVGDPCACGEMLMDEAMRSALDWRCEP